MSTIEWTPQRRQLHRMATSRGMLRSRVQNALKVRQMSNPHADKIEASLREDVERYRRERHEWLEDVLECKLGIPAATYIEHLEECLTILEPVVGRDAFDPEQAAELPEYLAYLEELDFLREREQAREPESEEEDGNGCVSTMRDAMAGVMDLVHLDPEDRLEAIRDDLCDGCTRAMLVVAVGLVGQLAHDLHEVGGLPDDLYGALGGPDVDD